MPAEQCPYTFHCYCQYASSRTGYYRHVVCHVLPESYSQKNPASLHRCYWHRVVLLSNCLIRSVHCAKSHPETIARSRLGQKTDAIRCWIAVHCYCCHPKTAVLCRRDQKTDVVRCLTHAYCCYRLETVELVLQKGWSSASCRPGKIVLDCSEPSVSLVLRVLCPVVYHSRQDLFLPLAHPWLFLPLHYPASRTGCLEQVFRQVLGPEALPSSVRPK